MTPEAQCIAIAELSGWKVSKHGWWSHTTLPDNGGAEPEPPSYLTDLNPIHAAIRAQPLQIQRTISQNLTTKLMTVKGDQWDDNLALILATPEMLCEQLLRAAGKWEVGK